MPYDLKCCFDNGNFFLFDLSFSVKSTPRAIFIIHHFFQWVFTTQFFRRSKKTDLKYISGLIKQHNYFNIKMFDRLESFETLIYSVDEFLGANIFNLQLEFRKYSFFRSLKFCQFSKRRQKTIVIVFIKHETFKSIPLQYSQVAF